MINVSGCGKSNALLHVISHETDIDQIYLHAKDPYETKHQFLIISFEHNDSKAFTEYSNNMNDVYKNIEQYNLNKKQIIHHI